jgi:protein TonB
MKKLIYSSLFAMLLLCFCIKNASAQEDKKVYSFLSTETTASYPGGMASFYKFISENMKYPEAAVKDKVQGSVLMSFTVEKDGTLNDIKVNRGLGSGTDEEAVRVLGLSKKWNPGLIDGKPVRVKYNIPVQFSLSK